MTLIQTMYPNRVTLQAGKQGTRFAEVRALTPVFEKSNTELKLKPKDLRCKSTACIVTLNIRTLNRIDQLPELTASVAEHNIDIVCKQEHRYYQSEVEIKYHDSGNGWTFISASSRKNFVKVVIREVGIFLVL